MMIWLVVAGGGVLALALFGRAKTNADKSSENGIKADNGSTGTGGNTRIGSWDTNGDGSLDGTELKGRLGFGGGAAVEDNKGVQAPVSRGKPPTTAVDRTNVNPVAAPTGAAALPKIAAAPLPTFRKPTLMGR